MIRLLKSNLSRMAKNRLFWVCMILSVGVGAISILSAYIDFKNFTDLYLEHGIHPSIEESLFTGPMYLVFAAAVFVGSFAGTDYSCGTLRNKIIAGHSRIGIYLSNLLTALIANIGMLLVFNLAVLAVGLPLLGIGELTAKQITLYTLSQCLTMAAFTALLVFLSMLFQSKAGGSVAVLVLTVVLFASAMIIPDMLRAPEYYEGLETVIVDEKTGETIMRNVREKNPSYVDGIKRDILETLDDALPVNQFYSIIVDEEPSLGTMAAYSAAITVLITGAGILLFRKKNLT